MASERIDDKTLTSLFLASMDDDANDKVTLVRPVTLRRMITEICQSRASTIPTLTEEEREALEWVPAVMEDIYQRFLVKSAMGECEMPSRKNIDTIIATIGKLLAGTAGGGK